MDDMDHDLHTGPPPITILTGFLGAGKTARLNRILTGDHGLRVAVLVNDFGSITIDADLVVGVKGNVISLANGRICCTIRDDLIDTVMATIDRPEQPECIVLEASGVAEPSGIAVTFTSPTFRDRLRLDSILCMVDAEQLCVVPELMELKIWQIACADMVIFNREPAGQPPVRPIGQLRGLARQWAATTAKSAKLRAAATKPAELCFRLR
jgi:G3E family GTPase